MLNEYINSSFMTQTEKFNQNMVFETETDRQSDFLQVIEEKLFSVD